MVFVYGELRGQGSHPVGMPCLMSEQRGSILSIRFRRFFPPRVTTKEATKNLKYGALYIRCYNHPQQ